MSLSDTDKVGLSRITPQPNHNDQVIQTAVKAHKTLSTNYTTDASTLATIQDALNGQFTIVQVGDFTTTSTYTATNPGAGNYASNFFQLLTLPHGLGYLPGLIAYEQSSAGQFAPMPLTKYGQNTPTDALWYTFYIFVDSVNVYIQLEYMVYGNVNVTFQPGFIFKFYLTSQTSN